MMMGSFASYPPLFADAGSTLRAVPHPQALAFGQALRSAFDLRGLYDPDTQTYALASVCVAVQVAAHGDLATMPQEALALILRGDRLPSEFLACCLGDALFIPRAALLYLAGYITSDDLNNYPGANASLAALEADIALVATLPLEPETRDQVLRDLHSSARLLRMLLGARASRDLTSATTQPLERELVVEALIALWEHSAPPPPPALAPTPLTSSSTVPSLHTQPPTVARLSPTIGSAPTHHDHDEVYA